MSVIAEFPLVSVCNSARYSAFQVSHDFQRANLSGPATKALNWFGHKALTVVCVPANVLAIAIGSAGMALTAASLGAAKVAIFALTLGTWPPEFSIGFLWLGKRTISSGIELLSNVGELIYDAGDLVYQGYRGTKALLTALKLDALSNLLKRAVDVAAQRVKMGIENAELDETNFPYNNLFPSQLKKINDATHERSCLVDDDQSLCRWFEHKLLSSINVAANGALFGFSTALYVCKCVAVAAKVALFAVTNIRLQCPVGYVQTGQVCITSAFNVLRNSLEVILDVGLPLYRAARALHLTKVAATVRDLVNYTFSAVFS